ncbi:glycoside hydrolase family 15 protein [Candidatus Nitrospira nitrificans]|uniref:Glycoside hydrolase, family 15 n=1 Tax=Candidatus Nitrospira nitrificans TaxID=1742973 RepID=A0A0S4LBG1_9BACT|nr:glycoside hydrolase family 15 protein [Candidatus Nitrospira nitrificans]CUS34869.1 Glycoside hydrolase, family 15 [Candidatus Nitrospira nitrificans]
MYQYGLIGNCQVSALISAHGSLDWLCLPRPDSPPIFGKILDQEGGQFSISASIPSSETTTTQQYLQNTNILVTTVSLPNGDAFRITDFCPRFLQYGRIYRPAALFRIVEPLNGSPSIRVCCKPVSGWDKAPVRPVRGNSHVRYDIRGDYLRLLTNMPLTYLCEETPVILTSKMYFALTWGLGIEDDLVKVSHEFLDQTTKYWQTWVKQCSIPVVYQEEVIRSALALKLNCYEDTGAILAAPTTSLPEEPGGPRNWDYRYCWLRDAHFSLSAFHNLGQFEEMEGFLKFLLNVGYASEQSHDRLAPVYKLSQDLPLPEIEHVNWQGFLGSRPVRSHNQAAEHTQSDVYGEMILTLAPIFFDNRFIDLRTKDHEALVANLVRLCERSISQPDAGPWEIRNGWKEHSFTNLMCWAGLDRAYRMQRAGFLRDLPTNLDSARARAANALLQATKDKALRNGPTDDSYDASLAQLAILGFPDREVCDTTITQIKQALSVRREGKETGFFFRYLRQDDFGKPQSSFVICSFWVVQALAKLGRLAEAKQIMNQILAGANGVGLFAEHFVPDTREQLGNFPQAYSHVGLINAAFAVSPPWSDVL